MSDKTQQQDPATTNENQHQRRTQNIAHATTGEVLTDDAPHCVKPPPKGSSEPTSTAPAKVSSVPTSANAASSKGSSELTSTKNPDGFRIPTIVAACPVPILKGAKWRQLPQPKGSSDPIRQRQLKGPSGPTCHAAANYSTSDTSSVPTAQGFGKPIECTGPSGPKKPRPAGGLPSTSAGNVHICDTAASTGSLLYVNDAQMRLHVKAEQQPNNYGTRDHMVLPTADAGATQRRNEPSGSVRDLASILDTFKPQPLTNCSRWSICVPGPNKTGWEPLEDCRDHIRNERPHLRIEEAIPCFKTICKIKGARRPQCATVIGRLSISSFGKMYAILWASRHHLKPKLNPEDASESRRTNEVVLDFINSVARSRSSELPELVNRYFDVIRDGFTDEPFMPYDFQTATMRWQDGCPTAAAFLKAHPSGPIYFQPDFLNRCRRDIREAYLRVAEPGFIEALEWTRMRNYQVLMQFQRPWTPLREISKIAKDLVIKVHVNQDQILQEERVVFCDSWGSTLFDESALDVRVVRLTDVPTEALAEAKKYFMGHLVRKLYWCCSVSELCGDPEGHTGFIRKVTRHFTSRFPWVQLYTVEQPGNCKVRARDVSDSSESLAGNRNYLETKEPYGSMSLTEELTRTLDEPSGSPPLIIDVSADMDEPSGSPPVIIDESTDMDEPSGSPPLIIDESADMDEPSGSSQPSESSDAPYRAATAKITLGVTVRSKRFFEPLGIIQRFGSSDPKAEPRSTGTLKARLQLDEATSQPSSSNQETHQVPSDTIDQAASNATEHQSINESTIADEDGSLIETDEESQCTDNDEEQSHEDEQF